MTAKKKASFMLVLCVSIAVFNLAMGFIAPAGGDFFFVAAVLWGAGAVVYYFLDFDGRGRR